MPQALLAAAVVLLGFSQTASGHGCLTSPPSWFGPDKNHDASLENKWGLCTHGESLKTTRPTTYKDLEGLTTSPFWFAHKTKISGVPTLKREFRTYNDKVRLKTPWMKPGSADLDSFGRSPCGWLRKADGSSYTSNGDARKLAPFPDAPTTEWFKGSVVDVSWAISANHGGGYAYRLCKKPADGDMTKLTEACFQQGHLDFVGDKSWVEYRDGTRIEIPAKRTNEGTSPAGKKWTRNPIPGWKCASGSPHSGGFGGIGGNPSDCQEFNFHPPQPSLAGYGYSEHGQEKSFKWAIVDKVQIPAGLNGDYVLSWRWDSEQTEQVWAHCADVKIVDSITATTTLRPTLPPDDQHMLWEWEAHSDSVCRLHQGDTSHNGGGTIDHKGHLLDSFSLDTCKFACMQEVNCTGIEFHEDHHHCEIWSEDIGHILKKSGFICQKLTKRIHPISAAETKGQPVVADIPRHTWATMHMATASGIAAATVLAVAVMAVRRMARSTTSQVELLSDMEAEQTLAS